MGASQVQILRVFLLEGAVLGLAGSVFGCALAVAAIAVWERFVVDATGVPLLPIGYDWKIFAGAAVLATLTGLASAIWPALRGARLDPVVAIRG
jgi:lipoprotein-releasing system permease protein